MILKQSGGAFPHQTPFGQLSACAFLAQTLHQPLPTPRQMPDGGGESEQLLAGPRCVRAAICSPFSPPRREEGPSPPAAAPSRLSARRFIFPGPLVYSKARFIVSRLEQGETRPGGVARSGPRAGGALPVGGRGARSRGPGSALLPRRTRL